MTVNAGVVSASATGGDRNRVPACVLQEDNKPPENLPAPTASTITTLQQAYYCTFGHSYAGPVLDSRTLLVAEFAEFTKELQRRGLDRPQAITRTAGIASGDTHGYLLNHNNTIIGMPSKHIIGANGEIFAGIGVPPDYYVPLTPANISAGRDPGTDKAVELFTS